MTIIKILLRTLLYAVCFIALIAVVCVAGEGIFWVLDHISKWASPVLLGLVVLGFCAFMATGRTLGWDGEPDKEDEP